ncbi:MAG: circularly permuted type 2 ATP-grasp protein [Rhodospirillales bacterium]
MSGTTDPWQNYKHPGFWCEFQGNATAPLSDLAALARRIGDISTPELRRRSGDAERELFNLGITFTVYSDNQAIDRILPFDVIPRVIRAPEWKILEEGVKQRVAALNLFLHDLYHDQKILKDGVIPSDLVLGNEYFQPAMMNVDVRHNAYVTICGTDLVRGGDGEFYVLEDNARTPSGVSYVVENRVMMARAFPELMESLPLRSVGDYGFRLRNVMNEIAPADIDDPQVVLLSPGTYNSAYFEHIFLAREMGVPLVEGRDLLVENDRVYMKTTGGLQRVDSIYRRIDDEFLDPQAFSPDSMLGVPGLFECFRKGNVAIANAVGTGVADDKAVYCYMPRIVKYYLDQEPILKNVETNICREPEALKYTLDNLENLVVKPVGESGGYGIVIGPKASRQELDDVRRKIIADPANFISQPVVALSVCPTLTEGGLQPRHVDLRPFAVTGESTWVLPGGLTRVALKEGSMIVNSSQGGGSKDTWVLSDNG